MSSNDFVYPPTPENISKSITDPSPEFRREAFAVFGAIIFFIGVYFVLMIAAFLLAALCAFVGFSLAVHFPRFFTIMIAIGLVGLGVLVVFFLVKFVFKKNKVDRSHLVEIEESEQPELFEFIRKLTKETQTSFPKKIYLSADVNACVFYDSSFWSMFFPIRKNLQIGLGLVNSVNISELKAILAHEFGHFSQKSMKLGSYVYNVNQIIYNMLYDNAGYSDTVQGFANISSYFAFFAGITVRIVSGIQLILQNVYSLINQRYLSLSRQMEFHADAVAASVAGADHLITSLYRLEVANHSYSQLFEYYNQWLKKNLRPVNIYPQHGEMMKQFAEEHGIAMNHGMPQVNSSTFARFNKSRIVVSDQWASHPSTPDREAHLNALGIKTEPINVSAWTVFRGKENLQQQLTEKLYSGVSFQGAPAILDFSAFQELLSKEIAKYKLSSVYKGFFDFRYISKTDFSNLPASEMSARTIDEVLVDQVLDLPYKINGLKKDLETLSVIQKKSAAIKTFDFNGNRYNKEDAGELFKKLEDELKVAEHDLITADHTIIAFFLEHAARKGEKEWLVSAYADLFNSVERGEQDLTRSEDIIRDISPIYYEKLSFITIHSIMNKVKLNEGPLKERLEQLLNDPGYAFLLSEDDRWKVEKYIKNNYTYFSEPDFYNENLAILDEALRIYNYLISERNFTLKKELLEKQLEYLEVI